MSHDIWQDSTGKDCMFVVGDRQAAWHQLGQRCDTAVNWETALKLAGLDWTVSKEQNLSRLPVGIHKEDSRVGKDGREWVPVDSYTIFRSSDGAELGTVGADYTVMQNQDAFKFVDTLLEANGGSHYDSAGALGNGSKIWCAVRVPSADLSVMGQDKHETYLVFATSHDGSMAHTVKLASTRVVCQNTLHAALHESGAMLRVRHTKNGDARLMRAKQLMTGVTVDAKSLEQKLNTLAQRRLTRETMTAIMDRLFPKTEKEDGVLESSTKRDNVLAEICTLYESNDNNAFPDFAGSAYNLLNAVTEYTDHFRSARITDNRKGYSLVQARAENAVSGTGETLKNQALEVILEMTDGAPINRIVSRPFSAGSVPVEGTSLLDQIVG